MPHISNEYSNANKAFNELMHWLTLNFQWHPNANVAKAVNIAMHLINHNQFDAQLSDTYRHSFVACYYFARKEKDAADFQLKLATLITPLIKSAFKDTSDTKYQYALFRPMWKANYYFSNDGSGGLEHCDPRPEVFLLNVQWDNFLESIPATADTIDFSWYDFPPKDILAQLPARIKTIDFGKRRAGDDYEYWSRALSYIPPHIKAIRIGFYYAAVPGLSTEESSRRLHARLPITLRDVQISNISFKNPPVAATIPDSYYAAFASGVKKPITVGMTSSELRQGILEIVKHYLGKDDHTLNQGFFVSTWRQCKYRTNRNAVNKVMAILEGMDDPLMMLHELKKLAPKNNRGGLKMRINLIQHILSQQKELNANPVECDKNNNLVP